jgi:hypothetical protein
MANCVLPSKILAIWHSFWLHFVISDVPAWLGLKARALAWPETALAFKIVKPSHEPKPGQSWGLALACSGFWWENIIK